MTCGCPDSRPAAVTSRKNRRRSRSVTRIRLSTFTATSRPTATCQPRYTVAKPPVPRTLVTLCPGMSGAEVTARQPSPAARRRPAPRHRPHGAQRHPRRRAPRKTAWLAGRAMPRPASQDPARPYYQGPPGGEALDTGCGGAVGVGVMVGGAVGIIVGSVMVGAGVMVGGIAVIVGRGVMVGIGVVIIGAGAGAPARNGANSSPSVFPAA